MARYQNTATVAGVIVVLVVRLFFLQARFATPMEASFGRALLGFNPYLHQPPPPSYPLYVAMGKLLNFFIRDSLATLLALSVIGSVVAFVFLARAFPNPVAVAVAIVISLVPLPTKPLPDAPALACFAAALYLWRQRDDPKLFGIAAAAAVGCVPQTIVAVVPFVLLTDRRAKALAAFAGMLFVEFLQVMQNIELRRMRAFIVANVDLTRTFDPWAVRIITAVAVVSLTYHFVNAEADDLARDPDVQRGGEH